MKLCSHKLKLSNPAALTAAIISICCLCNGTLAQTKEHLPSQEPKENVATDPATRSIQQCITLMEQKRWQDALDSVNKLITKNKGLGLETYGAKFGTCYYYRGLCMLKLAQSTKNESASTLYESAIQSFNQCYAINPPNDPSNVYRAKSLLLRGNAEQALKRYQSAINSYTEFLNERNTGRDRYSLSEFDINLAICMWKNATNIEEKLKPNQNEDIQDAIILIQQSLLHSGKNSPSPQALITGLNTLSQIGASMNNDDMVPTAIERIKNTSPENLNITREAEEDSDKEKLVTLSNNLKNLSQLILKTSIQGLPNTSHKLTTLYPGIQKYATTLDITQTEIPNTKTVDTILQNIDQQSIINVLKARAISLLESDNPALNHSAVTIHQIIVEKFPNTPDYANNFYSLIHAAAKSIHPEDTDLAIKLASQFLKEYPTHPLYNATRTLYLSALYQDRQYNKALELASHILQEESSNNSNIFQSASFIHAAAHYYLTDYSTAETLLKKHATSYPAEDPNSLYSIDIAYLLAATQNQLLNWEESIPQLKAFIKKHSDSTNTQSIYTPFAYYDLAYALYLQGNTHSAILALQPFALDQNLDSTAISPLDNAFDSATLRNSQVASSAAILLGNIRVTLGQQEEAVSHYADAIQLAIKSGNLESRDEAYYCIINILGSRLWNGILNDRLAETVPYYEEFIALPDAKSSPYYIQILTSATTALSKLDTAQPIHITLQNSLFLENNKPNTPGIEANLKTYLLYLRKNKIPSTEALRILSEDLKTTNSAYHQALTSVAKIEILEREKRIILAAGKINKQALSEADEQISQYYHDLTSLYRPEDLDNFALLKIAEYLSSSNNTETSQSSVEYYQAIIQNQSTIKLTEARLGLALLQANSNNPEDHSLAKKQLLEIINDPFTTTTAKATSHYNLIKIALTATEPQWNEIEKLSIKYLNYPLSVKNNALEVQQSLALAFDKQGKTDNAIARYTQIWASSLFSIQHSAPAIQRVCELLWQRNNPATPGLNDGKSDRQLAYETTYKYIRTTKDHFAKRKAALDPNHIQTWEDIKILATETYANDSNVKTFQGQP